MLVMTVVLINKIMELLKIVCESYFWECLVLQQNRFPERKVTEEILLFKQSFADCDLRR